MFAYLYALSTKFVGFYAVDVEKQVIGLIGYQE